MTTTESDTPDLLAPAWVKENSHRRQLDRRRRTVWAWGKDYKGARYSGHIDDLTPCELEQRVRYRWQKDEPGLTVLEQCGRFAKAQEVSLKRAKGGRHYLAGRVTCSSVWSCPACAPQIRAGRAALVSAQLAKLGTGNAIYFLTLTARHGVSHELDATLDAVMGVWSKAVVAGKAYRTDRDRYGMLGWIRTVEVTYSPKSKTHHPHLHAAIVTERVLTDAELKALEGRIYGRWSRGLVRAGLPSPSPRRGIVLKRVTGGRPDDQELAEYLSKYDDAPYEPELEQGADDGERWISEETARGDRKLGRGGSEGRGGSLGPFQLLDLAGTPDEAWARNAFVAYQRATHGRRFMTSGGCLKGALRLDDYKLVHSAVEAAAGDLSGGDLDFSELIFERGAPVVECADDPALGDLAAADDWPDERPDWADLQGCSVDADDLPPTDELLDSGVEVVEELVSVLVDPETGELLAETGELSDVSPGAVVVSVVPSAAPRVLPGPDDLMGESPPDEPDEQFIRKADRGDQVIAVFDREQWGLLRDDQGGEGLLRFLDLLDAGREYEAWTWVAEVLDFDTMDDLDQLDRGGVV